LYRSSNGSAASAGIASDVITAASKRGVRVNVSSQRIN
jgi:hypothetical protein